MLIYWLLYMLNVCLPSAKTKLLTKDECCDIKKRFMNFFRMWLIVFAFVDIINGLLMLGFGIGAIVEKAPQYNSGFGVWVGALRFVIGCLALYSTLAMSLALFEVTRGFRSTMSTVNLALFISNVIAYATATEDNPNYNYDKRWYNQALFIVALNAEWSIMQIEIQLRQFLCGREKISCC